MDTSSPDDDTIFVSVHEAETIRLASMVLLTPRLYNAPGFWSKTNQQLQKGVRAGNSNPNIRSVRV